MGLSHGGLRQKMFNVYEETLNVPMVFSNPRLFPKETSTDALASLIDVLPTMLTLGGRDVPAELRGRDLSPILAAASDPRARGTENGVDLSAVSEHPAPARTVQDAVHFTYDDHQAGTATRNAPGQPNRIRAIRTDRAKYAFYFDPEGKATSEYELYDLERDPLEVENLVDVRTGEPRSGRAGSLQRELEERLELAMDESATKPRTTSASA
jgi:arylsulfatase A-like enzyme